MRKIFRQLFVHIDLYGNDLQKISLFGEKDLGDYVFAIIADISGIDKLQSLIAQRGEKFRHVAEERLRSGNFICFCFIESASAKAAYSRWLRRDSFYHDRFKETIRLAADEAFTMDSYTPPEFRGKGLHKEMNRRMLDYCKRELKLHRVLMVILRGPEYLHLHKIVRELGYRRLKSRFYFKTEIVKTIMKRLKKSNVQIS